MAVAKAIGAMRVVAVDINPLRLEFARSYAATDVFLPPTKEIGESNMSYAKRISALMKEQLGIAERGPAAMDTVIDATGAESCIQAALLIVKTGGRYVQVRKVHFSCFSRPI